MITWLKNIFAKQGGKIDWKSDLLLETRKAIFSIDGRFKKNPLAILYSDYITILIFQRFLEENSRDGKIYEELFREIVGCFERSNHKVDYSIIDKRFNLFETEMNRLFKSEFKSIPYPIYFLIFSDPENNDDRPTFKDISDAVKVDRIHILFVNLVLTLMESIKNIVPELRKTYN